MIELQKKIVLPWAMVDYYKYIDNKQLYACLVGLLAGVRRMRNN